MYRSLQVTLLSAKGIKMVKQISKMDVYVVATVSGDPRSLQKTSVHKDGGSKPVDVLRSRDPRCCQVDTRFQPRLSYGLVDPAKDVRTGCPDTPSDSFVSHGSRD